MVLQYIHDKTIENPTACIYDENNFLTVPMFLWPINDQLRNLPYLVNNQDRTWDFVIFIYDLF